MNALRSSPDEFMDSTDPFRSLLTDGCIEVESAPRAEATISRAVSALTNGAASLSSDGTFLCYYDACFRVLELYLGRNGYSLRRTSAHIAFVECYTRAFGCPLGTTRPLRELVAVRHRVRKENRQPTADDLRDIRTYFEHAKRFVRL